jgi:hypothetical protein
MKVLLLLSKEKSWTKVQQFTDYFDFYLNNCLRKLLNTDKDKLLELLKKYKYIYIYHRYSDVSNFILLHKKELKQIVIIHDPLHCQFNSWERNMADKISCWCTQYTKQKINDSHDKLFFMKLPFYNTQFYLDEENIHIKNIDDHIKTEKYIVSIGNAHRDYNTLIKALENINIKCYIITTNSKITTSNQNIIIKSTNQQLVKKYIKYSLFGIIPITQTKTYQAHGVTVACELSALKKPFIISEDCGINDYLMNETFGLSYKERNVIDLTNKIKYLLDENNLKIYKNKIEDFYKKNPDYLSITDFINTFNEKCKESTL